MIGNTRESPRKAPKKSVPDERIRTVTGETFKSMVLEGDGPIAVEFMSYGCAYCRALEPILEHVAELVKTKQQIFRINVPAEHDLADAYDIQSTPTLVMFLNGSEVGRVEGPRPKTSSVLAAVTLPFES
jgi:thioredoxin-like negative regulator of GroEL